MEQNVVKRTFIGMVEAGEPLMRQALEAIRQAHEAEAAGLPDLEVQRLHPLADCMRPAKSSTQPRNAWTWCALNLSGHQF